VAKQSVGVIHPGQMGVVVADTIRNSGHEVWWASEGRSEETRQRAARFTDAGSITRLCGECSVIVSVCPPEFAEEVAHQVAACSFHGLYLDANAISPDRTRRIGRLLAQGGATFVDGCIIGMPARTRGETWLYVSGEQAERMGGLFGGGPLEIEVLADEIGPASALKMCFAAQSKGSTALLAAVMSAAEVLGVRAALERQWSRSGPNAAHAAAAVQQAAPKAWRFVGEMKEIAETFESAGIPSGFPLAAEEVYERLAGFKGTRETQFAEVLRKLPQAQEGNTRNS
jgi:3-hydroxyisobutyrate dehydrogenase-like beta-hydroxyacid dehydrogenase